MRSSSIFSTQERRYRPIVDQHGGIEEKCHKEQGATFNVISKRSAIIFKRHIIQNGMKLMKVHEKEAYFSVGLVIKPFTLVVVLLLFITGFLTITFPITSFDSERNLLITTAQQSWDSSSKRANKQMVKMWENIQETEAKIKMIITKKGKIDSIRSKLLYWEEMVSMLESLTNYVGNEPLKLGLLNYDNEINHELEDEVWGSLTSIDIVPQIVALAQANQSMTWGDLYPVWIDEEEVYETPRCPSFPMAEVEPNTTFDVAFAYVPCNPSADWRRDVLRLHLQLSIANVAVKSKSSYVLLHSRCPPFLNLFTCNDLALHKGNLWLYKVDIPKLQRRLTLPVGSCELAPPMKGTTRGVQERKEKRREAYATILHSADMYVCGAIALGHSIRRTGSTRDMIILVDNNIQQHHRQGLQEAGWIVLEIERIRNPRADPETYNEYNYSKLRLWQLTAYKKIIFLDADVLVLRNIDLLFESEEISASGNSRTIFNSGLMVLEPSNCTFNVLMHNINLIVSYNGGDQGFLNEIFVWWHRLPRQMNFLKHFYSNSQEEFEEKTKLFGMYPPQLYVLHFLGYKPWLCFRDYDCSWLFPELRNFASDVAHATWWKLHDTMPHHLQQFCLLSLNQTYILTADMDTASQVSSNPDPLFHWQRNITDPRFLHPPQE